MHDLNRRNDADSNFEGNFPEGYTTDYFFSQNGEGIVDSIGSIAKITVFAMQDPCLRVIFVFYIAAIVEKPVILIADLKLASNFSVRLYKNFIKSFSMFKFQMQFLWEFADNINICDL